MSLKIKKTIKLFINGEFPRTESGRSYAQAVHGSDRIYAELCQASRKDLRAAVEAAKGAEKAWGGASAYLRAQILYRLAEMIEGKRAEFVELFRETLGVEERMGQVMVDDGIDACIYYAGFADKFSQLLATLNPVQGSLHNFTFSEPVGVVAVVMEDDFDFARLMRRMCSVLCSGNTAVVLLSAGCPAVLAPLGEALLTSDMPKGAVNLLTGHLDELFEPMASHMEIRAVAFQHPSRELMARLEKLAPDNMKRVVGPKKQLMDLEAIHDFVEFKTTWAPVGF